MPVNGADLRAEKLLRMRERQQAAMGQMSPQAVRPLRYDGYTNVMNKWGTNKDTTEHYHFRPEADVPDQDLTMLYEGNGLFAKIIDTPAEEAIKHGFELKDVSDVRIQTFYEEALDALDWEEKAATAVKWTRLFGGALMVMMVDDGQGLDQPLNWNSIRSIDDLLVFERAVVQPDYSSMYYNYGFSHPLARRGSQFGKPEYYNVMSRYGMFRVHESRCLLFRNGILPENTHNQLYQLWGIPEYIRIRRALRDAEIAHGDATKMLDRSVQSVYKSSNLVDLLQDDDGENQMIRRLESLDLARGLMGTIAIDKDGEDYEFKTFTFSGVAEVIDTTCNLLSALTSIPQTILFGRSPAGMSATGESDFENYYNFVSRIQKLQLKHNIRDLLSVIFQAGLYTGEIDEVPKINVQFKPLWSLSEKEQADLDKVKADTAYVRAQTANLYMTAQVLDPSEVRKNLATSDTFDVENILDEAEGEEDFLTALEMDYPTEEEGNGAENEATEASVSPAPPPEDKQPNEGEQAQGVGVLVVVDGKILTGRRLGEHGTDQLCGPGGHVEPGETTEQAARRESMEEFGILPVELIPLGNCPTERDSGLTSACFLCTEYEGEPCCDEEEMTDGAFRSLEELAEAELFPPFEASISLLEQAMERDLTDENTEAE